MKTNHTLPSTTDLSLIKELTEKIMGWQINNNHIGRNNPLDSVCWCKVTDEDKPIDMYGYLNWNPIENPKHANEVFDTLAKKFGFEGSVKTTPNGWGGKFKMPTKNELEYKCTLDGFDNANDLLRYIYRWALTWTY